jgi:hypothetical protein
MTSVATPMCRGGSLDTAARARIAISRTKQTSGLSIIAFFRTDSGPGDAGKALCVLDFARLPETILAPPQRLAFYPLGSAVATAN